ncbi:MAG: sulfite reductase [NADPH] flavoprotein alpha-component, partial [Puniceicoccaceae bacterium]
MSESTTPVPEVKYGVKNPFPSPVKTLVNLNGRGSAKETCHLELSLAGSGLEYVPGDVAGVFPVNCPEVVDDFLKATGFSGEESVENGEAPAPLRDVLSRQYNITTVNLASLKKYATAAENDKLTAFVEGNEKDALNDWLWGREWRDFFVEYPPSNALD